MFSGHDRSDETNKTEFVPSHPLVKELPVIEFEGKYLGHVCKAAFKGLYGALATGVML